MGGGGEGGARLHKVHFQALGSAENLLTGSITRGALVQRPGWRFPTTLLPSIKKKSPPAGSAEGAPRVTQMFSVSAALR